MRHLKLLGLAPVAALIVPTVDVAASQHPAQRPGFSEETRSLLAQAESTGSVLLEVEGVLEEGDDTLPSGGLIDIYPFQGRAGQPLSIRVRSEDFEPVVMLILRGDEVRLIAGSADANQQVTDSQILVRLPVDGTYVINIVGLDRGNYQLLVTEADVATDRQAEADRLYQQGVEQYDNNQYQVALESWQAALELYQAIGNREEEGDTLNALGLVFMISGQVSTAINYYEQALVIAREIGDRRDEGNALGNLGNAYHNLGQYQEAIAFHEQNLVIAREIGDRRGEGGTLSNLGLAYARLGEYQEAISLYEQRLAIAREMGDRRGEGAALNNLGNAYHDLGQYQEAILFHEQNFAIAREIGDRQDEAAALGNLGITYYSLGQYAEAIALYEQDIAIRREIGDRRGEGAALGNLGNAYRDLGQYQEAIALYEQSLAIDREIGNRRGEGATLGNLGSAYRDLGQYQEAILFHEQNFAIAREIGDRQGEGIALGNLGNAYRNLGQYQTAIDFHKQSLAISREIGDRRGEGITLGNLGFAYHNLGQYQTAIDFHEQSLAIAREIGDRAGEGSTLSNQGIALIFTGQFSQAESTLRQSLEAFESLRAGLSDDQLISIADTQAQAYANLERALTAQDKTEEALAITERGRGRAFVLQLASRLAGEAERAALEASPVTQVPTIAEIQQIARDTNTTLVTYSQIFDQALYIWVVQPTGEIEFRKVEFDGSGEDGLAINPIASIDGPVYRSAAPDSELTSLVTGSRTVVDQRQPNPTTPQLQELHQVLIDPIADLLPSDPNAQVAFIPQGELFLVPFAALQDDDGTYLIEKHTILTAPSIQVFGLASEAGQESGVRSQEADNALIVGNPTMPTVWLPTDDGFAETQLSSLRGAETEAKVIGEFFNIPVLTGKQATEARIKQELPNASLIHLATHGLLEYGIPESSGVLDLPGAVALAPGDGEDGLLTSAEILEMDLRADLAILSACDTGRGRITGDGVVGLSRALITAGVPSVMVSLWAVNDDSTSVLMQRFYEILATGEFTKAEALRQAQLSLLYAEDVETRLETVRAGAAPTFREGFEPVGTRHPYHWAPFVLIGHGR